MDFGTDELAILSGLVSDAMEKHPHLAMTLGPIQKKINDLLIPPDCYGIEATLEKCRKWRISDEEVNQLMT